MDTNQIVDDVLQKDAQMIDDVVSSEMMRDEIVKFLTDNPDPADADLHKWAEEKGYDVHKVETEIYKLATKYVETLAAE